MEYVLRKCAAKLVLFVIVCSSSALAQTKHEFHQTFAVSIAEPVRLRVELLQGDTEIAYSREGEVTVSASQVSDGNASAGVLANVVSVTAVGNQIEIRQNQAVDTSASAAKIAYRIDVPYRTEVFLAVKSGKQTITGIMGPVSAEVNEGDIRVSYVSKAVLAHAERGNLDLQVIGEHIEAMVERGSISCSRAAQGVRAEAWDGNISLMRVGPSQVRVRHGAGKIDVAGVSGTLIASTDAGSLHVRAVPHDDWQLSSESGEIGIELPAGLGFDLDAMTNSGEVVVARDDFNTPSATVRQLNQKVNAGGRRIEVRSKSGRIAVS